MMMPYRDSMAGVGRMVWHGMNDMHGMIRMELHDGVAEEERCLLYHR